MTTDEQWARHLLMGIPGNPADLTMRDRDRMAAAQVWLLAAQVQETRLLREAIERSTGRHGVETK